MDMQQNRNPDGMKRITVYASSSSALAQPYYDAARRLGGVLGDAGMDILYGGGGVGLMGAMADEAMAKGAQVHGVIPEFLNTVEHGHQGLSSLKVVNDMRERKHLMLENSDAVVSLPGGSGTFEEVFEVLTLKRLGQFLGPIVFVNTNGYYDRMVNFLQHSVSERFMSEMHLSMWSVVNEPEDVLEALASAPCWSADARRYAAVGAGA